jgi:hypothetical protein
MNKQQAHELVRQTLTQRFDKGRFLNLTGNILHSINQAKAGQWNHQYVKDAFKEHIDRFERLGTYTGPEKESLDVLVVHVTEESKLERARTALRNFVADHLKQRDEKDAALVAFVSPAQRQWRFSYVKMEYATTENESGKVGVEARLTPARRFSYIVGEGESCHTAQTRFLALLQHTETDPRLADIEEAFSVEAVTNEFYQEYRRLFEKIEKALRRLAGDDNRIKGEFEEKGVSTVDFAKKLMGQIVFLYFLQKKGWLGVAKDAEWGTGPRDFLRKLARGEYGLYANFFNDVLEPLFYDTLATDRGHEAWCGRFKCRIPFLNGGLFEPLGNYDWRGVNINVPDKLFTNSEHVEEGVTGSGILDLFDRYNFTVNEAEPLEKEVAIDPEMLGKVFENLIEENLRKGLGSYYTPREIVHYMCQESLINYLDTRLNKENPVVPRADIETLVHLGDQIAHYESVDAKHGVSMPGSIKSHAREIDGKLAEITACDPTVGSGAFPVGMMTEIVRARLALTPYFNDPHERSAYIFKRHAIQSCLYGVDIDPGAIDIAKLRLWLSLVVDEEHISQIKPLPNLDYKMLAGNSLFAVEKTLFNEKLFQQLENLKPYYFDESDVYKKAAIKAEIDRYIHELTKGNDSFDFEVYFSEVFHRNKGFDVVIANPPYIFARESEKKGMTDHDKQFFYEHYELAEFQVNSYPLFVEKGTELLRPDGCLCFITPNNWMTINTNKAMRKFVLAKSDVRLVNFYARVFESADVDSSIVLFRKSTDRPRIQLFEYKEGFRFINEADCSVFTLQPGCVISIEAFKREGLAEITQKIDLNSYPLDQIAVVKAGLKAYETGCGSPPQTEQMKRNRVYHSTHKIDSTYIKYLDGKDVCRYFLGWSGEYLKYGDNLAAPRRDFRLYSTERILVRQIPAKPPYCIHACLTDETLLNDLNSINVINIRDDPGYVLGVLNSRLVSFWFVHKFGKMQRETFPQFKVNELAKFPLPNNGGTARHQISKLAKQILAAKKRDKDSDTSVMETEIDWLLYRLYDLTEEEIAIVEGYTANRESAAHPAAGPPSETRG